MLNHDTCAFKVFSVGILVYNNIVTQFSVVSIISAFSKDVITIFYLLIFMNKIFFDELIIVLKVLWLQDAREIILIMLIGMLQQYEYVVTHINNWNKGETYHSHVFYIEY